MSPSPETQPEDGRFAVPSPHDDPDAGVEIFYRRYRPAADAADAPPQPILLLHGHPQSHVIWHRIAPRLFESGKWDVVTPDLRGHGASGAPHGKTDLRSRYSRYSKREMARDMVELMKHLGYPRFYMVGHDRGARVAHRLALDHPESLHKLIVLDIAPTLDMYRLADHRFATLYWHWFFLIQAEPFPERVVRADPLAYLNKMVTKFLASGEGNPNAGEGPGGALNADRAVGGEPLHPAWAVDAYLANLSDPKRAHAMCEDYRASAPGGVDLLLDDEDRMAKRKVKCPVKALWGTKGVIESVFKGGLDLWRECCDDVDGRALDGGHYLPEERPGDVLQEIAQFFC